MRCGAALLLLALFPTALQAQPTPDTTDWRGYYPIQVGNAWEYQTTNPLVTDTTYRLVEMIRDTTIDGRAYTVERHRLYIGSRDQQVPAGYVYVRYDTTAATVRAIHRLADGTLTPEEPYYACDFSAPFDSMISCPMGALAVSGWYLPGGAALYTIGADPIHPTTEKSFFTLGTGHRFLHGIGLVSWSGDGDPWTTVWPSFARVGGIEYGRRVVATTAEPDFHRPAGLRIAAAYPNPFSEDALIAYETEAPGPLTVTLYDALGRRIHRETLGARGAGKHVYRLTDSGWPAGVYALLLETPAGARAVQTLLLIK